VSISHAPRPSLIDNDEAGGLPFAYEVELDLPSLYAVD